jgi:AcrR family transcriptional regulator
MTTSDCTREKIIEAAKDRFTHYGYGKTTMAELATDCAMSSGNLYRFFAGKLDIAEEICRRASIQSAVELNAILEGPGRKASERLRDFLFQDLRSTFAALEEDPRIVEMAQLITAERPEFHDEGLEREREVLAQIVRMGQADGEFRDDNPVAVAETIQAATMKFSYPQLFSRLSLEKLETELEGVYQLIVCGLKRNAAM